MEEQDNVCQPAGFEPGHLKLFVVMSVQVADEEIEDGHVHQIEQPSAFVVRTSVSEDEDKMWNNEFYLMENDTMGTLAS